MLNSSSINAVGDRKPITPENWTSKKIEMEALIPFLMGLKNRNGKLIRTGRRKTFIVGFCIAIKSILELSKDMFSSPCKLKCFFTRLVQQDYLEHYFGFIHQRCGSTDNPTFIQLRAALKRLMIMKSDCAILLMKLSDGVNCSPIPAVEAEKFKENSNSESPTFPGDNELLLLTEILVVDSLKGNEESPVVESVKKGILAYLAGYVVDQTYHVSSFVKCCDTCKVSLVANHLDPLNEEEVQLLKIKNRLGNNGGLIFPSKSVTTLVSIAQNVFENEIVVPMKHGIPLRQCNLFEHLTSSALTIIESQFLLENLFPLLNVYDLPKRFDHKLSLARTIVYRYVKLRTLSYPHVFNAKNKISKRNKLRKTVQFRNE